MRTNYEIRYAAHPEDAKSYDTKRIRRDFLIEKVFSPNEVNMVYSMYDRMVVGGAMPVGEVLQLIKASSHANITVEDIRNIEVLLPKHDEEKKRINIYFENLDHLITLHQRKCDELKKIKKFMLQNMFV